jgi:hypothetical protein
MKKALLHPYGLLKLLPLLIILPGTLFSCKKEMINSNVSTAKENLLADKTSNSDENKEPGKHETVTKEFYNSTLFDSCRQENVVLSGEAIYKLSESFDRGYYINYEIDLEKVTGVGEITGIKYHGGGKILGIVKQNENATKVKGKVTYKVKYVGGNGNQIFFTQNARFLQVNNVVKIDFNNIYDSCK